MKHGSRKSQVRSRQIVFGVLSLIVVLSMVFFIIPMPAPPSPTPTPPMSPMLTTSPTPTLTASPESTSSP